MKNDPDDAIEAFNKLTPVKKRTVRNVRSLWIDDELKDCMIQRDQAKKIANNSNYES